MSRNESLCQLKARLHCAISEWAEANCETDAWEGLGAYFGDDLFLLMSEAAMAVLKAQVDANRYFEESGMLK